MFFRWMDEYAVGVAEVDREHKLLVHSINELYVAMQDNKSSERIPDLFNMLADYTLNHFATEQVMMEEINYPHLEEHLKEHRVMSSKLTDMKSRYENGTLGVSVELLLFLRDWLNNHILETDHALAQYLLPHSSETVAP